MTSANSSTTLAQESPTVGINAYQPRLLHTAYFVADIERSLQFYSSVLGMKELQRFDLGEGVHEVVMTFPNSRGAGVILMWNLNRNSAYQLGDGYSRLVMSVNDLDAVMAYLAAHNVFIKQPRTETGALAYVLIGDPDGYIIELLEFKRPAQS